MRLLVVLSVAVKHTISEAAANEATCRFLGKSQVRQSSIFTGDVKGRFADNSYAEMIVFNLNV